MQIQITIDIPAQNVGVFEAKVKQLTDRGFRLEEAKVWAAIYVKEYPLDLEETNEKIIAMFGANLLHTPANIQQLALELAKWDNKNKIKKLLQSAYANEHNNIIYYRRSKSYSEELGNEVYSYYVRFDGRNAYSYTLRMTEESFGKLQTVITRGGTEMVDVDLRTVKTSQDEME